MYVIKVQTNGMMSCSTEGDPVSLQLLYSALGILQSKIIEAMQKPPDIQVAPQGNKKIAFTPRHL